MKTFQKIRLSALLLLTALAAWATRSDPASTGYEFIPDMAHSVPYDAYAPNPVTRDGKTLQPPVAGTIARGGPLPFHYAATAEDAARAGRELRNPFPPSPATAGRGRRAGWRPVRQRKAAAVARAAAKIVASKAMGRKANPEFAGLPPTSSGQSTTAQ